MGFMIDAIKLRERLTGQKNSLTSNFVNGDEEETPRLQVRFQYFLVCVPLIIIFGQRWYLRPKCHCPPLAQYNA